MNSLTLVREHNAGSARLSAAYRTDQSDRADVFWHCHTFDHDTFPLQCAIPLYWKTWDPEIIAYGAE
jgi:hypothetical protein